VAKQQQIIDISLYIHSFTDENINVSAIFYIIQIFQNISLHNGF